jgi:hypothetical protein
MLRVTCQECAAASYLGAGIKAIMRNGCGMISTFNGLAVACSTDGRTRNGGKPWVRPDGEKATTYAEAQAKL